MTEETEDYLAKLRFEIDIAAGSTGFIGRHSIWEILWLCHEHGEEIERQLHEEKKNSFPSGT